MKALELNRGKKSFGRNIYEGFVEFKVLNSLIQPDNYKPLFEHLIDYQYDGLLMVGIIKNEWRFTAIVTANSYLRVYGKVKFMNPLGIPLTLLNDDRFAEYLEKQSVQRYIPDGYLNQILMTCLRKGHNFPYSKDELLYKFKYYIDNK